MVGINRAEVRNCVNYETACELVSAFQEFESSDDLRVAVLYGKGGTFCAGYDLKSVTEYDESKMHPPDGLMDPSQWRNLGPSMMQISKPVIGAISGYAVAGGLELALMCDMRVVEESAILGVFCRRFGVPLIDGGTVRLPALIGLSRAMDLILTGRPVDAKEAHAIGLANRVVADGTAVGEALKLAGSLCNLPQQCMLADRRSAYHAAYQASTYEEAFQYEYEHGKEVVKGESVKGFKRFQSGEGRHGKTVEPENLDLKSKL